MPVEMGIFPLKICQRLQRSTGNILSSCRVTEHLLRTCRSVSLNSQCSSTCIHRNQVPLRLYSNNGAHRKFPMRSLTRTDTTKESISRIEMLGLEESELSTPALFNVPLGVIEQRLQYCVEGGIKCSSTCIVKFSQIIGSRVSVLRSAGLISEKTDVVQRILSNTKFIGPYPTSIEKDLPFSEIHFKVLNHCMEYEYGYTFPNWQRYHEAPLMYAQRNMDSVKDIGLNWNWIRNHPSLLCFANPYNLFKLFQLDRNYELPMSITNLLRKDADIAFVPYEDLKATFFILKKYNVCSHDISKIVKMEHFLVNPDYLDRQFQKLDTEPKLDTNNLLLLYKNMYLKSEKKRKLDHLEKLIAKQCNPYTNLSSFKEGSWQHEMKLWMDSGDISLQLDKCRHKPFGQTSSGDFLEEYSDVTDTIDELKLELQSKRRSSKLPIMLAEELELPIEKVKTELTRIPLALTFETKHSYATLKFLLSQGFTREEISETLQLLLYKRDLVEETLNKHVMFDQTLQSEAYKCRRLHVCLYHILMKYDYNICIS